MVSVAMRALRILLLSAATCMLCHGALAAESRFIVKFRDDGAKAKVEPKVRVARIAEETGLALAYRRPMALGLEVLSAQSSDAADMLAAKIAAHPDVEWVEADHKVFPDRVPNDEVLTGQGYLSADTGSIN